VLNELPKHPNLENLRKRAKRLLHDYRANRKDAVLAVRQYFATEEITLRQVQHVVGRQYGFNSWAELAYFVNYRRGGGQMASRVNWFWIPVNDLDRAGAFYKQVLACEVWIHREDGYAIFEWEKGDVSGGLILGGIDQGAGKSGADGIRVLLNCEGRLDAAIAQAKANGGKVEAVCTLGEFGLQAIVRDTEGNMIHLHSFAKAGALQAEKDVALATTAKN
jgi:predicted enzyme related to lactoylglutathione lyase